MPNKSKTPSRTNSITPASDLDGRKREDDSESVDMIEETDDEGFDDESCDEARQMRVRFKVRGLLRVIIFVDVLDSVTWSFFCRSKSRKKKYFMCRWFDFCDESFLVWDALERWRHPAPSINIRPTCTNNIHSRKQNLWESCNAVHTAMTSSTIDPEKMSRFIEFWLKLIFLLEIFAANKIFVLDPDFLTISKFHLLKFSTTCSKIISRSL